ncbi:MAG TPA: ferredoxin--NADP reductase [Acidimicrobiales bacterium]
MAISGAVRDHGFHPLRVARVVPETAESASFVLDVPEELRDAYAYEAGQFLTFRVPVDGEHHLRSYSMSSSPAVDAELQVTVKRVPGGLVSNAMIDTLGPGDVVEATRPAGVFCLGPGDADVVAFAAGSGITPVFSLLKAALAGSSRQVRLLYANRDRESVIFRDALDALVEQHPERLAVVHRLDVEHGFVDDVSVAAFADGAAGSDVFVCGPTPFMDIVEGALLDRAVDPGRIHIERFDPAPPPAPAEEAPASDGPTKVTIELDGRTGTIDHHPGTTILQTAREMGMAAPFSCEAGNCATCMARVLDGAVTMYTNNALTDDEVADGWVLTCQSVPTTPTVHVVYGYGEA